MSNGRPTQGHLSQTDRRHYDRRYTLGQRYEQPETHGTWGWTWAIIVCVFVGVILVSSVRSNNIDQSIREGAGQYAPATCQQ